MYCEASINTFGKNIYIYISYIYIYILLTLTSKHLVFCHFLYKTWDMETPHQGTPSRTGDIIIVLLVRPCMHIRDWSLITGRGGGLQNGKIAGLKLFAPPPQDRVKLFMPPLLKSGNFS